MDVYIDRNKFKFKGCLRTSGEAVEKGVMDGLKLLFIFCFLDCCLSKWMSDGGF